MIPPAMTLLTDLVRLALKPEAFVPAIVTTVGLAVWFMAGPRVARWLGTLAAAGATAGIVAGGANPNLILAAAGLWLVAEATKQAPALARATALIAPALFLAFATGIPQRWPYRLAMAGFVVLVFEALRWQDTGKRPLSSGLVAITALGVFATVPDTNSVLAIVVALPVVALPAVRHRVPLGSGGSAALLGCLTWAAVVGGVARPAAIVGALGSFGVILIEPMLNRLAIFDQRFRKPRSTLADRLVVAAHCVIVAISARVAGLQLRVLPALVLAGLAVLLGSLFLLGQPTPAESPRDGPE